MKKRQKERRTPSGTPAMKESGRYRLEIWVEDWLLDRLGAIAKKSELSRAEVARLALESYVQEDRFLHVR